MINIFASISLVCTRLIRHTLLAWVLVVSYGMAVQTVYAQEPDWDVYGQLLKKHVVLGMLDGTKLTTVNYQAVKTDPLFQQVIRQLSEFPVGRLANQQEQLAFYINAYNIYAIKMVVDHLPVESIKDIGSWISPVWKKDVGKLAGKVVSLDEIEHKILRPMGDPRIHMAIVCASVSCPDLRMEPFTASLLDKQLDEQALSFLNNSTKGLQVKGSRLSASKIFDWFGEDFDKQGGVVAFIRQYRPELPDNAKLVFGLEYNWKLNKHG